MKAGFRVSRWAMNQMLALYERLCLVCDHIGCQCPKVRIHSTCQYCGGQSFTNEDGTYGETAYGDCESCSTFPSLSGLSTTTLVGKRKEVRETIELESFDSEETWT